MCERGQGGWDRSQTGAGRREAVGCSMTHPAGQASIAAMLTLLGHGEVHTASGSLDSGANGPAGWRVVCQGVGGALGRRGRSGGWE